MSISLVPTLIPPRTILRACIGAAILHWNGCCIFPRFIFRFNFSKIHFCLVPGRMFSFRSVTCTITIPSCMFSCWGPSNNCVFSSLHLCGEQVRTPHAASERFFFHLLCYFKCGSTAVGARKLLWFLFLFTDEVDCLLFVNSLLADSCGVVWLCGLATGHPALFLNQNKAQFSSSPRNVFKRYFVCVEINSSTFYSFHIYSYININSNEWICYMPSTKVTEFGEYYSQMDIQVLLWIFDIERLLCLMSANRILNVANGNAILQQCFAFNLMGGGWLILSLLLFFSFLYE